MSLDYNSDLAIRRARELAERRGQILVLGEHLAYTILTQGGEGLAAISKTLPRSELLAEVDRYLAALPKTNSSLPAVWSQDLDKLRTAAAAGVSEQGRESVTPADLLLAYLRSATGRELLRRTAHDPDRVLDAVSAAMEPQGETRSASEEPSPVAAPADGAPASTTEVEEDPLERFGRDLTQLASDGVLDPVSGRDTEIRDLITVLIRKSKSNPLIVGQPGTGKTAVVEGLAARIASGDVPHRLRDVRLIELSLTALLAGAKYRGEFEERLESVLKKVRESAGKILLFLDEIHTLVGAGGAGLDAANILKPALARGEIMCIGATTLEEFKIKIQPDKALARRFTEIEVKEPEDDLAFEMLQALRPRLEAHYGLQMTDDALRASVELGRRYIWGQFLPDKARDLVEAAAAHLKLQMETFPEELHDDEAMSLGLQEKIQIAEQGEATAELEKLKQEFEAHQSSYGPVRSRWLSEREVGTEMASLRSRRADLVTKLARSRRMGDTAAAAQSTVELDEIEKQLLEKQEQMAARATDGAFLSWHIGADELAQAVQKRTGIPVGRLMEDEREKLLRLDETLRTSVVGQDEAINGIVDSIHRNRAGVSPANRPVASLLFVGPTGVGKTHLAKTLARELFGREDALVRIDMGEYQDKASHTRLVGAPPGYVGYDGGGQLTEAIRRRPFSVILFDEMEKAHEDILLMLLQLTDEAKLTDGRGMTFDFSNALIIFTSNAGAAEVEAHLNATEEWTPEDRRALYQEALKGKLRQEFLGRLDTVIFNGLGQAAVEGLVARELKGVAGRVQQTRGLEISWSPAIESHLASFYDSTFGARSVLAHIRSDVEKPLARHLIERGQSGEKHVRLDVSDDGVVLVDVAQGA